MLSFSHLALFLSNRDKQAATASLSETILSLVDCIISVKNPLDNPRPYHRVVATHPKWDENFKKTKNIKTIQRKRRTRVVGKKMGFFFLVLHNVFRAPVQVGNADKYFSNTILMVPAVLLRYAQRTSVYYYVLGQVKFL